MQQTVLFLALRGPDGLPKYSGVKMLLRFLRRCILICALEGCVIDNPHDRRGGSFTGPSLEAEPNEDPEALDDWSEQMQQHINDYIRSLDGIPHHFQLHFMHSVEIVGYEHPDARIRFFWNVLYLRLVNDMHLQPESRAAMNKRLGDSYQGWLERAEPATVA